MTPGRPILAIDTATTRALVALGDPSGTVIEARTWTAGYRHGEELLSRTDALLRARGVALADLGGIAVGTGPGAFTGLRVGLASVKGIAHAMGLPVVGVATAEALLAGARAAGAERPVLIQPAGPNDRVESRPGQSPRILPGGTEPDLTAGETLVAVDLEGRAPADAVAIGDAARDGLAAALLAIAARRLAAGDTDDLAELAPEYVVLPRGVRTAVPEDAVELTGGQAAR